MIGIKYTLHCGNIHHSKRQKIYRSNFSDNFLHLPAAFMIFGFTTSWCFPPEFRLHLHWLLERSSWVKLCVHWRWRYMHPDRNQSGNCLNASSGQTIELQWRDQRINLFKDEPIQTTPLKICILGWIWKYMQEGDGNLHKSLQAYIYITGKNVQLRGWGFPIKD